MPHLSEHQRAYPAPDDKPTALPEARDGNLWAQAKKKANAHFKGKKAPKHVLDAWAVDWYTDQGGLFKENGDGGMVSETKRKAKVKNKDTQKQKKEVLKSSILLLPIFAKKLTTKERAALKPSDYADPENLKYPIPDTSHAIDALSRVSANGDIEEIAKIHKAVYKKFPFLKKGKKSKASYANAPHNLRILSNVLNTLAASKAIQVTPRGPHIFIISEAVKLKLDKDALYQPQASFNKIISKLSKALLNTAKVPPGDAVETMQATIAKYEAQVQTLTDKIAALKEKMQKTQETE